MKVKKAVVEFDLNEQSCCVEAPSNKKESRAAGNTLKNLRRKAKDLGDLDSARKYLFFRRIQTEAKDYVLGTLNKIFFDLDKWLDIKK